MFIIPKDSRVTLTVARWHASADQPRISRRTFGFHRAPFGTRVVQGKDKSGARPGSSVREIVSARLLLRIACRMNDGFGGAGQWSHGKAPGELDRRLATR